jgi:hypothetical protein
MNCIQLYDTTEMGGDKRCCINPCVICIVDRLLAAYLCPPCNAACADCPAKANKATLPQDLLSVARSLVNSTAAELNCRYEAR